MSNVVFVHAHPDDESLLSAGTMRGLHERGHNVILIVATDGAAGLTSDEYLHDLANTRSAELARSARALGISQVLTLGYSDSGIDGSVSGETLVHADLEQAALRLNQMLAAHDADVLVGYDQLGGYGHPDHVKVHQLVRRAAEQNSVPVVLEVTADRQRIAVVIDWVRPLLDRFKLDDLLQLANGFSARADIAYTVDVRRWCGPKRGAMKAHASQNVGGNAPRTLRLFSMLPLPLFRRLLGREWYTVVRESGPNPIAALPRG